MNSILKKLINMLLSSVHGILLCCIFSLSIQASSETEDAPSSIYETGLLYIEVDDQMAAIDRTLSIAKKNGKLALIVMGANWCHDSRSMASNLYSPKIKDSIEKNYQLLFVDVGYYTKIKKVINRFGMPIIYSTPTILIVDPESEKLINQHNMLLMRDAASVSELETLEYFEDIANNREQLILKATAEKISMPLARLNQSINDFEALQAKRIYKAFSVIGPLIKEKKDGGDPKQFIQIWKAISTLRYTITDDLELLRKQAKMIAANENSKENLEFPKYPSFEWEKSEGD